MSRMSESRFVATIILTNGQGPLGFYHRCRLLFDNENRSRDCILFFERDESRGAGITSAVVAFLIAPDSSVGNRSFRLYELDEIGRGVFV